MRGVTNSGIGLVQLIFISTHTPHARRDIFLKKREKPLNIFQLTRLMRGVTIDRTVFSSQSEFQLTRLMRGVTEIDSISGRIAQISTHTPHARRDITQVITIK